MPKTGTLRRNSSKQIAISVDKKILAQFQFLLFIKKMNGESPVFCREVEKAMKLYIEENKNLCDGFQNLMTEAQRPLFAGEKKEEPADWMKAFFGKRTK